jgi:hypothetical protein
VPLSGPLPIRATPSSVAPIPQHIRVDQIHPRERALFGEHDVLERAFGDAAVCRAVLLPT